MTLRGAIYWPGVAAAGAVAALLKYRGLPAGEWAISLFALAAGAFLTLEAGWKLARWPGRLVPRFLRMVIGATLLVFHAGDVARLGF